MEVSMKKNGARNLFSQLVPIFPALGNEREWSGHRKTKLTHGSLDGICGGLLTILKVNLEEDQVLLECDMHANYIRLSLAEVKSKVG